MLTCQALFCAFEQKLDFFGDARFQILKEKLLPNNQTKFCLKIRWKPQKNRQKHNKSSTYIRVFFARVDQNSRNFWQNSREILAKLKEFLAKLKQNSYKTQAKMPRSKNFYPKFHKKWIKFAQIPKIFFKTQGFLVKTQAGGKSSNFGCRKSVQKKPLAYIERFMASCLLLTFASFVFWIS